MQELKEHYLSQTDKPQKVLMFEYFSQVKHEIRMGIRERERIRDDSRSNTI